ncbi:hypothetical protein [Apilactobacillus micheneri]|uniref:hypothetical protein n=1 Tax=Apilactobacillus micheneri TaxID=1899430 RepID=UPI0011267EBC|nr:hypothetical protein [Apilactobacillus micheneri]
MANSRQTITDNSLWARNLSVVVSARGFTAMTVEITGLMLNKSNHFAKYDLNNLLLGQFGNGSSRKRLGRGIEWVEPLK